MYTMQQYKAFRRVLERRYADRCEVRAEFRSNHDIIDFKIKSHFLLPVITWIRIPNGMVCQTEVTIQNHDYLRPYTIGSLLDRSDNIMIHRSCWSSRFGRPSFRRLACNICHLLKQMEDTRDVQTVIDQ